MGSEFQKQGRRVAQESLNSTDGGGLFPRLQQRYSLRDNPLEMETPFYPDAMRQHALETLRHLCGFGDMVLVLTGAPGSGKTRVLAELVRSESSRLDFHRIPASALTSRQALARYLKQLAKSGIPADSEAREAVYRYFRWSESGIRRGHRQVLLIDDAERVESDVLNLLVAGFVASERSVSAVPILAGTEQVWSQLEDRPDSAYAHHLNLPPLSREDIKAYLEPRVHRAGGSQAELLSTSRLKKLEVLSQGSFGRLKRVAPGVWLDMVPSSATPSSKAGFTVAHLRWPALGLLLLAASWWFVSQQYESTVQRQAGAEVEPEPVRKSITIGPGAEEPEPEMAPLIAPADEGEFGVPGETNATSDLTQPLPETEIVPEPEPEP
ncbi:hypothetical protein Q667_15405, partial [Marinobacter sp. C1S70]